MQIRGKILPPDIWTPSKMEETMPALCLGQNSTLSSWVKGFLGSKQSRAAIGKHLLVVLLLVLPCLKYCCSVVSGIGKILLQGATGPDYRFNKAAAPCQLQWLKLYLLPFTWYHWLITGHFPFSATLVIKICMHMQIIFYATKAFFCLNLWWLVVGPRTSERDSKLMMIFRLFTW